MSYKDFMNDLFGEDIGNELNLFGLRNDFSLKELIQKRRELAKKYHPDINTGMSNNDANKFMQEINRAYSKLFEYRNNSPLSQEAENRKKNEETQKEEQKKKQEIYDLEREKAYKKYSSEIDWFQERCSDLEIDKRSFENFWPEDFDRRSFFQIWDSVENRENIFQSLVNSALAGKNFDTECFDRYIISLYDTIFASAKIPLGTKNVKGLEMEVLYNLPFRWRLNSNEYPKEISQEGKQKNEKFSYRLINDDIWKIENKIYPALRIKAFMKEAFSESPCIATTQYKGFNKRESYPLDIISSFNYDLVTSIKNGDYEIELSDSIPLKQPGREDRNVWGDYGLWINNLRLGKREIISEGLFNNLDRLYEGFLQTNIQGSEFYILTKEDIPKEDKD